MVLGPAVSSQVPARVASSGTLSPDIEYTAGDRIFENGSEVIWRGVGVSYLLHSTDYQTAWKQHLPQIQSMELNTIRLAFAFPDSTPNPDTGSPSADILIFSKLDWVLDFLAQNNIKGILDCHNYVDMYGDFGSPKLFTDWRLVANHYKNDPRVAAYELFNEPHITTWAPTVKSRIDVARIYSELTDTIRKVDLTHIVIWQSEPDFPSLLEATSYLRPNTVFTFHRWLSSTDLLYLTPEQLSYSRLSYAVEMRREFNVPFWFGEFGSENSPFNASNPEWLAAEQTLWKCEEQAIGWNLWMGEANEQSSWEQYLQFFPLNMNTNLTRTAWNPPGTTITEHMIGSHDLAINECYRVQMWYNGDYITLSPNITIRVIVEHVLSNSTVELVSNSIINLSQKLTIQNEEDTQTYPGDWNTFIFLVAS